MKKLWFRQFPIVFLCIVLLCLFQIPNCLANISTTQSFNLQFSTGQSFQIQLQASPPVLIVFTVSSGSLTATANLNTTSNSGIFIINPTSSGTLAITCLSTIMLLVNGNPYTSPVAYSSGDSLTITWSYSSYLLTLNSYPRQIGFGINGSSQTTPYYATLISAFYTIIFPSSFIRSRLTWTFLHWEDNSTNPSRTINLQKGTNLIATYIQGYVPIGYTGSEPVFECAMNNMFEMDGILEGNDTYRQMLFDSSPYENHGKIYPTSYPYAGPSITWGAMGQALQFDGVNDYVRVPNLNPQTNSYSLNFSQAITVEFWFMAYNTSIQNEKMISKYYTTGQFIIGLWYNQLYTELWTTSGIDYTSFSNFNITDGIFYHIDLTYDYRDGYYTVWMGGVEQYNVTTDANPIQNANVDVYLGSQMGSMFFFDGVIDEIRIFPYKRQSNQIYSDARTPIAKFGSTSLVNSGTSDDGYSWNVVTGTTSGYQGFTSNDPELPWAYSNDTHAWTFVRTLSYMAGFQAYQLYCNLTFDCSEDTDAAPLPNNYVDWYWNFFKNGHLEITYDLKINPRSWDAVSQTVGSWNVRFIRTTPYYANQTLMSTFFYVNNTLFQKTISVIVSAWIGPDDKHFTLRVDSQDSRMITYTFAGITLPFVYSFDLVDDKLKSHILDWFDGWVVCGIKVDAHRITSGNWALMEIQSHKFVLFDIVFNIGRTIGGWVSSAFQWVVGGLISIVSSIATELTNILVCVAEIIGTVVKAIGNAIVDALSGLAHDIIGGLMGLGSMFGQIMKPIADLLVDLGAAIVNAFMSFMGPLLKSVLNAITDGLQLLIGLIDTLFGVVGWNNGFSQILSVITVFIKFFAEALSVLLQILENLVPLLLAAVGLVMTVFLGVISAITGIGSIISFLWAQLSPWFGWVLTLFVELLPFLIFLYVVWLFLPLVESPTITEGLAESKRRVELTIGYVFKIGIFFWQVTEYLINLVWRAIKLIPIVE
jgi:hypothetical protein